MSSKKPAEDSEREPNGTTLSVEEWIEEMNTCDRLHQYVKRRKELSEEGRGFLGLQSCSE